MSQFLSTASQTGISFSINITFFLQKCIYLFIYCQKMLLVIPLCIIFQYGTSQYKPELHMGCLDSELGIYSSLGWDTKYISIKMRYWIHNIWDLHMYISKYAYVVLSCKKLINQWAIIFLTWSVLQISFHMNFRISINNYDISYMRKQNFTVHEIDIYYLLHVNMHFFFMITCKVFTLSHLPRSLGKVKLDSDK